MNDYQNFEKFNSFISFEVPDDVEEEGKILKINAYRRPILGRVIFYTFTLVTCGFLFLLCKWKLNLRIYFMKKTRINEAELLAIKCQDGTLEIIPIKKERIKVADLEDQIIKTFEFRLYKFYYHPDREIFIPLKFSLTHLTNSALHEKYGRGIQDDSAVAELKSHYGSNSTEIPEKPITKILFEEILSPFNIFQLLSSALWFWDNYQIYASIILFTTIVSLITTLYDSYKNMKNLRKMSFFSCEVNVFRGVKEFLAPKAEKTEIKPEINIHKKTMSSLYLLPGDLIEIPENSVMPCDIIILNGSCIMNECMLTGESIPVLKNSLPYNNLMFSPNEDNKSSVLLSGTFCLETRYYMKGKIPILGLVLQTGFNTMKGQLVRSILFPKNNNFQFYRDSFKFLGAMALIAMLGFVWSMITLFQQGAETIYIVKKSFDMITVVVPPALPTCMAVGISFALIRLKKKQIFCISPQKINISGKVNVMCFDKTGTLTEEGLDTYGVRPTKPHPYKQGKFAFSRLQSVSNISNTSYLMLEILASCHSITSIKGKMIGDPLDIKMFESTGWILEENTENKFDEIILSVVKPSLKIEKNEHNTKYHFDIIAETLSESDELEGGSSLSNKINDFEIVKKSLPPNNFEDEIGIIRRFEFSSRLQRMSVIVKNLKENTFRLHMKGSPEKLRELCIPESIPSNFHKILDEFSQNGYRVLACATRILKIPYSSVHKCEREKLECKCIFMGFLIMENKLKSKTKSVINQLHEANVRTIMITGDNALTAISVARQCDIVGHNQRVYLGDLSDEENHGKEVVIWKDFDFYEKKLNPETLVPNENESIYSEEEKNNNDEEGGKCRKFNNGKFEINSYSKSFVENSKQKMSLKARSFSNNFDQKTKPYTNNEIEKNLRHEKEFKIEKLIDETAPPPWLNNCFDNYCLALTGRAFSYFITQRSKNPEFFSKILEKAQIYARMKPAEKALVITSLQSSMIGSSSFLVGMCGDGANDCSALKTADVGVSLSEAEASIAAPFTSKIQDISCIVKLLREGRCALSNSFQCFKYIAVYSMIQFITVTLLYSSFSAVSDYQFLWIDLFMILPLAIFMSYTKANKKLSTYLPTANLISFPVLSSVIGHTLIQFIFQLAMYLILMYQDFFVKCKDRHLNDNSWSSYWYCYENTTLFTFSNFQYISTVLAFSIGPPFRQEFYKNYWFTGSVILIFLAAVYIALIPAYAIKELLNLLDIETYWKIYIIAGSMINFLVTLLYEKIFVIKLSLKWIEWRKRKMLVDKK